MSRTLSRLRRVLLGALFLGSLGFGAEQAFAEADFWPPSNSCRPWDDTENARCAELCRFQTGGYGYCDAVFQECICFAT